MTSSLPRATRECFERFITTEYLFVDARQQPITWPVTPYYARGGAAIDVTTGSATRRRPMMHSATRGSRCISPIRQGPESTTPIRCSSRARRRS